MTNFLYFSGFRIDFLLILIIYVGVIFLVAKKFKFSRNKTILLFTALFIAPLIWFAVIIPKWHINIENKIKAANYCEIDSDCIVDYFDSFTCGSFVNKNENLNNIYHYIKLYRILSLDYSGCMGYTSQSVCENKKCTVRNKKY
ncbi:hypothetical protein KJ854_03050 [Patescibacteria group bacterium]|nr:hypothetical protein [Patescibacteria group bacterium]